MKTNTAVVARVVVEEDRTLIYPVQKPSRWGEFHIISSNEKAANIRPGDTVEYEPYGFNFGWLVNASSAATQPAKPPAC